MSVDATKKSFGWSTPHQGQAQFPIQPNAPFPTLPTHQPGYYPNLNPYTPPPVVPGIPQTHEVPIRAAHYGGSYAAPPQPAAVNPYQGPLVPEFYWVDSSTKAEIPPNAVESGRDADGTKIFIGMAWHEGDELPAKVIPQKNAAYVAYGGKEIFVENYKVLCQHQLKWVPFTGKIPVNAIPGGRTKQGETLYIGRAPVQGSVTVGKIHPSQNCCYIPFGGVEHAMTREVEILTRV